MGESESKLLVIGRISGGYGIKGWVKIHSYTDPAENFLAYGDFKLKRRTGLEPVEFSSTRRQGKGLVAHIKGVDDRTAAEAYKGLEILVGNDQLPALPVGEFYWQELRGLQVWCRNRDNEESAAVLLGAVDHLIETGANDVLVVKACEGSIDKQERLIPYLPDDVISRVDLDEGRMEINWFLDV